MFLPRLLLFAFVLVKVNAGLVDTIHEYDRPFIVQIVWEKALLPCTCSQGVLNCSDRAEFHINEDDYCSEIVSTIDLSHNQLTMFPDGFNRAIIVNVSNNRLSALPTVAKLSAGLKFLDISKNRIHNITESYRSLRELEVLRVGWNKEIRSLSFLPSPCALRILYAADMKLQNIEDNLRGCHNLEDLDVSGNEIASLPENSFSTLTELRQLTLSENSFTTISPQLFTNLTKLQILKLRALHLNTLPSHVFDSLNNLQHLFLGRNSLKTLPPRIFSSLSQLTVLDLSGNGFEILPHEALQNLNALRELKLSFNKLKTIPDESFKTLPNLREINLFANEIDSITTGSFDGINHLQVLSLNDNPLSSLPRGLFTNHSEAQFVFIPCMANEEDLRELSNITNIYISTCEETSLRSRAYAALSSVVRLVVNNNAFTSVAADALDGLPLLRLLDLSQNEITYLPPLFFSYTPNITNLMMYRNNLTTLPENIFSGLVHVIDIILANNNIEQLPENVFQGLALLERLDLSFNKLKSIPRALFNNLTSLYELSLESNMITTLPEFESTWPPMKIVSLSLNNVREVPPGALRSWLDSTNVPRYLTLVEEVGHGGDPASLQWLLLDPDIQLGRGSGKNCRCGMVRRGLALAFICVNAACPSGQNASSHSWIDTLVVADQMEASNVVSHTLKR